MRGRGRERGGKEKVEGEDDEGRGQDRKEGCGGRRVR